MSDFSTTACTAFRGHEIFAAGPLREIALRLRETGDNIIIFEDATGTQIDVDASGSPDQLTARLKSRSTAAPADTNDRRTPGRPRLGVVAREVTLLPRHWEWLSAQPGGASVALRKLVDEARRVNETRDRTRAAQEAAYRFMSAIAGDLPGYESAIRALFAGDLEGIRTQIADWPEDVRTFTLRLANV